MCEDKYDKKKTIKLPVCNSQRINKNAMSKKNDLYWVILLYGLAVIRPI